MSLTAALLVLPAEGGGACASGSECLLSAEVPGATLCPLASQTWSRQLDLGEERSGSSLLATGHSCTGTQHAQSLGLALEALEAVDSTTHSAGCRVWSALLLRPQSLMTGTA